MVEVIEVFRVVRTEVLSVSWEERVRRRVIRVVRSIGGVSEGAGRGGKVGGGEGREVPFWRSV